MNEKKLARIFKVLSVETRVRIIHLLRERAYCVNALAQMLNITAAAVSQHLRVLRDADLVIDEKRGYFVHYHINRETLAQWQQWTSELLVDESPQTVTENEESHNV